MTARKKKIYLLITAACLLVLSGIAVFMVRDAAGQKQRHRIEEARTDYEQGEYESALLNLRQISEPELRKEAALIMADCYEAMGNYGKAIESLREQAPNNAAIASRIRSLEEKRDLLTGAQMFTVAGITFSSDSREVNLDGKGLTDESLRELNVLYALDSLSLRNNSLKDVHMLAGFRGLHKLNLAGNSIEDIGPLADLRELRYLDLSGNPVSDFSPVRSLEGLSVLILTGTGLSEEELEQLSDALPSCSIRFDFEESEEIMLGELRFRTDIEELSLEGRGIRDLTAVGECSSLISLSLRDNAINDLHPLMNLPQLRKLDLAENAVTDISPLIGLPELTDLDLSDNLITDIGSLGAMHQLSRLDLSGNPIGAYSSLGKLEQLEALALRNTGIEDADLSYLETMTALQMLNLEGNAQLSERAVGQLNVILNRCNIICSDLIKEIMISGHTVRSNERKLSFPASGIETLNGLENMTGLEELDLSGNLISDLSNFEVSPARETLRHLNLANNRIISLSPIRAYSALEELNLSGNEVDTIDVLKHLTTLRSLDLRGNPLSRQQVQELMTALPECMILF